MTLGAFILSAASSSFVIADLIAGRARFSGDDPGGYARRTHPHRAAGSVVMAGILLVSAAAGRWIFHFLGITMPAFQIAASIVLLLVALDMLRAQRSRVQETSEETAAGRGKSDIAITPLAVPMLAGPGAISAAILLQNQAQGVSQSIALYGCILAVSFASYMILHASAHGAKWISPIAMKITTRIMGLLLAAVAVQFVLNAIQTLRAGG